MRSTGKVARTEPSGEPRLKFTASMYSYTQREAEVDKTLMACCFAFVVTIREEKCTTMRVMVGLIILPNLQTLAVITLGGLVS